MDKVDVFIIGGGLAGLSAASTLCAEPGLRVALADKNGIGSNRTTPAVFIDAVREFGLEESVLQQYSGFIQHSPSGACAKMDFKRVALEGIDYKKACSILFERAVKNGLKYINAEVVYWDPVVPNVDKPLTLRLNDGALLQTDVLVDASGWQQLAARKLNIRRSAYYSHCFGELLSGCHVEENSVFRFLGQTHRYGNGGGWFYPIGKDIASVGYSMVVPEAYRDERDLIEGYLAAKNGFFPYCEWLKGSVKQRNESGIVPVGRIGSFCSDRLLIVGDAAGQAHSWVVEGCRPALRNGKLCALTLREAFLKKRFDRKFLSSYERVWNKENRERFWRTESIAELNWNKSDEEWDKWIISLNGVPAEKFLSSMRDNRIGLLWQLYAVAGHLRRRVVRSIKRVLNRSGRKT